MTDDNNTNTSEHRDDLETLAPPSPAGSRTGFPFASVLVPDQRCRISSICQSVDDTDGRVDDDLNNNFNLNDFENNDQLKLDEEEDKAKEVLVDHRHNNTDKNEEEEDISSPLNDTRMDLEEERLDLNSVLSGTMENEDMTITMTDDDGTGVSVKNLSKIFEENGRDNDGTTAVMAKPARPPLAPGRGVKTDDYRSSSKPNDSNEEDKRLSVYLRIRPPVSASGKEGVDGSISTIEVLSNHDNGGLSDTIRTYPPLSSNAAKVVRTTGRSMRANNALSKSLNEESAGDDSGDVLGVKEYSYSGVFGPNCRQSEVYEKIAAPMVEGLFPEDGSSGELGESALLFTLGVTNAGKTHTVMGTGFEKKKKSTDKMDYSTPHKDWGIIPRSLHHMLSRVNTLNKTPSGGSKLQLYMSYLEIYNEQIYDLLPVKTKNAPKRPIYGPTALKLRESRRGRIFVRGLARHPVNDVQQGLDLADEAKKNRHTASNNINAASSRSHSICQFEIAYSRAATTGVGKGASSDAEASEYETDDDSSVSSAGSKKGRTSTIIWIVDLAGSERSKRTGAISHTRHQKEAALINASLMNLMRCLREMLNHQPKKRGTNKGGGVVPFRESKLTHMFMNHLTGPSASRTSMIVNVNPAADDFDETQHVLSYATTARSVKISMVDYNKKHRILAKESNVNLSPIKKVASLVKKFSPQKRKGTADSKPAAKRLKSNATALNKRPDGPVAVKKASTRPASAKNKFHGNAEVEQLKEEKFRLQMNIEDLEKQLAECEAEVRAEVVEMMNEQISESKEWYEGRIESLKQQLKSLKASSSKQASNDSEAKKRVDDFFERINECEEEMMRMREEHEAELEDKSAELLNVANMHAAEIEQRNLREEKLLAENGALRHQAEELRASHDAVLAKYNELLSRVQNDSPHTSDSVDPPACELASPNFKKLPRERCSDVASTTASVEIKSPKKKGKWGFLRSPAKVVNLERSPLGDVNTNLD